MCSEIYNITINFTEWYEHILSDYAGIDFFHEICVRPCDFVMYGAHKGTLSVAIFFYFVCTK